MRAQVTPVHAQGVRGLPPRRYAALQLSPLRSPLKHMHCVHVAAACDRLQEPSLQHSGHEVEAAPAAAASTERAHLGTPSHVALPVREGGG